jgi:hypothetical protein
MRLNKDKFYSNVNFFYRLFFKSIFIACFAINIKAGIVYSETTKAAMTANSSYQIGDVVQTAEFYSGTGGGGTYDVVSTSTVTPNGMNILIGSNTLISFKLRENNVIDVMQYGLKGSPTDDSANAQALLNLVGGSVQIEFNKKEFIIGEVNITNDNVKITGSGKIVKLNSKTYAFGISGKNCRISNLLFKGQSTTGQPNSDIRLLEGCENINITNNTFLGNGYSAVIAALEGAVYNTPVKGVIIANNVFDAQDASIKDWYARPLYLLSVENLTINSNIIKNTGYDAIRIREDTGFTNITNNEFLNIGDPSWPDTQTRDAIDTAFSAKFLNISNNVISKCATAAIDIKGSQEYGTNNKLIVSGNIINETRYEAISVNSPSSESVLVANVTITNNIINKANMNNATGNGGVGDAGIYIKGSVHHINIANNQVISCYGRGIHMIYDIAETQYASIRGNTVVNCTDAGIYISNIGPVIVSGNFVVNDPNEDNYNTMLTGIFANQTKAPVVPNSSIMTNNVVANCTSRQIQIGGTNYAATLWHKLEDNVEIGANAYVDNSRVKCSRRTLSGTSSPATSDGTFIQGDRIFNANPSTGSSIGWICTAGGNPGTWKSMGTVQ